jgi:aspartate kinase
VPERDAAQVPVVGIAGKPAFTVVHISKALMNKEIGFGRRFLNVIENHDISFEHMPSGIDTISVVIADDQLVDKLDGILDEMRRTLQPEDIQVFDDLALLTTVGVGMAHQVGIAARCFAALAAAQVNVRMISQGVNEINIVVGVDRGDFERAVRALYQAFVASHPEVVGSGE